MLTSLFLVSVAQAVPPVLSVSAASPGTRCPTLYVGQVDRATPGGDVAFVSGVAGGRAQIPNGMACGGTVLSVGNPVLRLVQGTDPYTGSTTARSNVPAAGCGLAVQALDLRTCTVSNVEIIQ